MRSQLDWKEANCVFFLCLFSERPSPQLRLYWQRYPDASQELASFLNLGWKKVLQTDQLSEILKWSWRLAQPIEELIAHPRFSQAVAALLP